MSPRPTIDDVHIVPSTREENEASAIAWLTSPDHSPEEREYYARLTADDEFVDQWLEDHSRQL